MSSSLLDLFNDLPEEVRSRALSHSSWVSNRSDSYGRLAFLGDSVLGLAVAREFFERHPDTDIGDLTKMRNQAVSGRACAEVAVELGLDQMMAAEEPQEGSGIGAEKLLQSERALASICEAVIGACLVERGFEITATATVEAFASQIESAIDQRIDSKTDLQELLARTGRKVIYVLTEETGPAHDPRFSVEATVDGEVLGVGEGGSKKEAEQAAAEKALEALQA
ncbi:MAG: ribonuclease III family protein [bacterium]